MVKTRSRVVFVLMFAIAAVSCGGAVTPAGTTPSLDAATNTAARPGAATGAASAGSASFGQILGAAKVSEYKVTYKLTAGGGQQSWYSKPPKTRYDVITGAAGQTSTVSIYSLPDGTFMCFGDAGASSQCIGMTGIDTALQQNPAALFQMSMIQHPEQFTAVLVETRQIAGLQAQCFDVKSSTAIAILSDGRVCYSREGIMLLQRFGAQGGPLDMEATSLSTKVLDSDFDLPSKPTVIQKP